MSLVKSQHSHRFAEPRVDGEVPRTRWSMQLSSSARPLVAGLVLLGLGWLTWSYIGRDVRRYLRIYRM
jgi:hypothetical protein